MATVFKEHYEVVGAAEKKLALAHAAARTAAYDAQWALVKSLGAEGFRPGHGGEIKSLLYPKDAKNLPAGLRKVGYDQGRVEYQPSLGSKIGKSLRAKLSEAPRVSSWQAFADQFGWKGRSLIGEGSGSRTGFVIYHCGGVHVRKPKERFFLIYPRELKDGWKPPKGLKLVRESDMLRAIEDHNARVKK